MPCAWSDDEERAATAPRVSAEPAAALARAWRTERRRERWRASSRTRIAMATRRKSSSKRTTTCEWSIRQRYSGSWTTWSFGFPRTMKSVDREWSIARRVASARAIWTPTGSESSACDRRWHPRDGNRSDFRDGGACCNAYTDYFTRHHSRR